LAFLFDGASHPVPKHKVSGALKVVNNQCAIAYSKTEKRQQKFFVSAKNGLKKERSCHFEPNVSRGTLPETS